MTVAMRGASFHLYQLNHWFKRMTFDPLTGKLREKEVELFHWHLRAFFWELVAARDVLKRGSIIIQKSAKALDDTRWFQEVNEYRNFTHESIHVIEVIIGEDKPLAFQLQPAFRDQALQNDGAAQLAHYWEEMSTFLRNHFPI